MNLRKHTFFEPIQLVGRQVLQVCRKIKYKAESTRYLSLRLSRSLLYPFYIRFFHDFIDRDNGITDDLLRLPALKDLDQHLNYFVLLASYGDKWCILSFLATHFEYYPSSRVLALESDLPLIEIFFGPDETSRRFIFIENSQLRQLNQYFSPRSPLVWQVVDFAPVDTGLSITRYLCRNGLPPSTLRPLHIVCYPYFMDLLHIYAVSYGVLLKTILYLPNNAEPITPAFYTSNHYSRVEAVVKASFSDDVVKGGAGKGMVLVNPVNFSHATLSPQQIICIVQSISANGFRVLINYAQSQCPDILSKFIEGDQSVSLVSVPADLLALVCCEVDAVIGVLGGAMNVAVQFGKAHVLSLHTPARYAGCDDDEFLGQFSGDRLWEWIDQDWPCLREGRVVQNKWIGDPVSISDDQLLFTIESFLSLLPLPDRAQSIIS